MQDADIERLRNQLKLLQHRMRREALPVAGLSRSATRVLGAAARSAQTRPGDLTDRLQMTTSNIAAALRELEAAGLVFRERDEQDRRKVRVVLTPQGQDVVAQSRRERDSWLGQAIETVLDPEEQDLLLRAGNLLQRIAGYEPPQS
ncbi:MarR family transcriptional regulator [Actinacidiphila sp. DG2A-62]|uniref:MarR family winged helix-turn-helix transcriptional regulator n=1 Tax=Actinacidiphila sp. DG2A-62 TaxID=3108821 RepID=UPI002DBA8343|nr:MarR family transcriptional regulator [Actinacidiphila sp. DG2A-62]MEC3997038.1 MarR family transcriptional regulator [Actinacidiphila sp. DG2A-62]